MELKDEYNWNDTEKALTGTFEPGVKLKLITTYSIDNGLKVTPNTTHIRIIDGVRVIDLPMHNETRILAIKSDEKQAVATGVPAPAPEPAPEPAPASTVVDTPASNPSTFRKIVNLFNRSKRMTGGSSRRKLKQKK